MLKTVHSNMCNAVTDIHNNYDVDSESFEIEIDGCGT